MACCVFTAFFISKIIKACEALDVHLIDIKYNDFDTGFNDHGLDLEKKSSYVATRLTITGMTCGACVSTIDQLLIGLDGVDRVSVSFTLERATVVHDIMRVSTAELITSVESAGYRAQVGERTAEQNLEILQHTQELRELRRSFSSAALLSSLLVFMERLQSVVAERYSHSFSLAVLLLGCWIQLYDASFIHQRAWSRARKGLVTMDTLISLSLLLGTALSLFNIALEGLEQARTYFASGSFLVTVITAGRYLDLLLKRKNAANFTCLYRLQAASALVKVRQDEAYVPAVLLRPPEEIYIETTSIVPCDCYVLEGASYVDQSTMTGEPIPVRKTTGDFLLSGTRNLSKPLVAVVYKEQKDSCLEQLIESISSATERKMSGQEKLESATTHFVTGVLVLTILGFLISFRNSNPALFFIDRVNMACERAMGILAASCPCALGIATPSAVMAGIDAAWSQGVLVTGGARTFEGLSKITHMVMDKTGTLTEGRLEVASYQFSPEVGLNKQLCYHLLCAVEREYAQAHPVGHAVFQWALKQMQFHQGLQRTADVRNHRTVPGKGVLSEVRGYAEVWYAVYVGSARFMEESGIFLPQDELTEMASGTTVVYFAFDKQYAGNLLLQDVLRNEAPTVIGKIKKAGVRVTLLTGDAPQEAQRISFELGIPVLASQSLPHEKKALIESLQAKGHKVAMVGDGINDSPAQAAADVGILLSLTRACMSAAAEVVIMSPDLQALPKLLEISKKTMAQAKRNSQWAIVYNAVALTLVMGTFEKWGISVDASIAGTMMAFSSVAVLGMSLHLRRQLR